MYDIKTNFQKYYLKNVTELVKIDSEHSLKNLLHLGEKEACKITQSAQRQ
jgi:hypothetical protein